MHQSEGLEANQSKNILFLKDLRELTAPAHVRLESNTLLSSLVSPAITLHQYYSYLFLMQHLQVTYENILPEKLSELSPAGNLRKSSISIANDLAVIKYAPPTVPDYIHFKLPDKIYKPGYLPGFMYVMEGSRLGGKVIFKNIHRNLGFSEASGASYLADYGFDTGAFWKKFITQFSAYVVKNDLHQATIEGATDVFNSIHNFFESNRNFYEI